MKGTPLQLMASKFALKEQIFATTCSKWSLKTVNRNTSRARRSSNLHNPDLGPWQLTSLSGRSWLGWELGGRRGLGPLPSRRRGSLLCLCLLSHRRHHGHQLRGSSLSLASRMSNGLRVSILAAPGRMKQWISLRQNRNQCVSHIY
jgi:hypothetical protein